MRKVFPVEISVQVSLAAVSVPAFSGYNSVSYTHLFLLRVEQVVFLGQQFHGILHAEVELLLDEVVAGLCASQQMCIRDR